MPFQSFRNLSASAPFQVPGSPMFLDSAVAVDIKRAEEAVRAFPRARSWATSAP
ncbi:hypothetical protein StoSoilB19_29170 [Arthrobacter sp. StoSoilB19]|nr:hypothetical protein StoSoilB19_29170 [Arthrobacter sp. StoSoilB19]